MSGAAWFNAEAASHLAHDAGMTEDQFEHETGVRPSSVGTDLARDTGIPDAEFAASLATGPAAEVSLAASTPPPD